jgi:drug/metabolite transporter (DMT)-like permease
MTIKTSASDKKGQISTRWKIALGLGFALLGTASLVRAWLSAGDPNRREFGLLYGVGLVVFAAFFFYRAFRGDDKPFTSLLNPPQD